MEHHPKATIPTILDFLQPMNRCAQARNRVSAVWLEQGALGRALAFGLVKLGADEIRLFDRDSAKAQQLAQDLNALASQTVVTAHNDLDAATDNCDGLLNGTPVGMVGYPGSAFEPRGNCQCGLGF